MGKVMTKRPTRPLMHLSQLIDCMWMFHFGIRPLLSLEDATVAVPCQEVLWEAATAREWQQTYNVSIRKSIAAIHIQK